MRHKVDALHTLMIGREPDLTILIDMDPGTGLERALSRGGSEERFESFGASLQAQMRQGSSDLAEEFIDRFVVIDGNRGIEAIAADVRAAVEPRLT